MNLSAPKQATFLVAVVLWLLALLGAFVPGINDLFTIANIGAAYWLAIIAGLVLIIGSAMKGI